MKEKKIQEALLHSKNAIRILGQLTQGSEEIREAYNHLKIAVQKMENKSNKITKKQEVNQNNAQSWWGTIQANIPIAKMSEQAAMKTLKELDKMLSIEQKKINELEQNVKQTNKEDQKKVNDNPYNQESQSGQVFLG